MHEQPFLDSWVVKGQVQIVQHVGGVLTILPGARMFRDGDHLVVVGANDIPAYSNLLMNIAEIVYGEDPENANIIASTHLTEALSKRH